MTSSTNQAITWEKEALRHVREENFVEATRFYERIIEIIGQVEWSEYEKRRLLSMTANCFERIGNFEKARFYYEESIDKISYKDTLLLGNYASFLYLHGSPREAFEKHLELFVLDKLEGDLSAMESTRGMLRELGQALSLTEEQVQERIQLTQRGATGNQ
jgi:tetratricopeptide (TPR) repeat protein